MKCPHCGYEWTPRVENPKKCPMCQKWLPPWKREAKVEAILEKGTLILKKKEEGKKNE